MTEVISQNFNIKNKFLRSTNLERDFSDKNALENYVLTNHALDCLERIATGCKDSSSQRAWRITGDYGTGKSSFALFLAHWLSNDSKFSRNVNKVLKEKSLSNNKSYEPLLVTGSREPMGMAILKALSAKVSESSLKFSSKKELEELITLESVNDSKVVQLLKEYNSFLKDNSKNGLVLIIDELGKFLEYAAMSPGEQDIYLMQTLAEAAAGSKLSPFFVIGILHQGFSAYASSLSQESMHEWEKVAGRYDELVFNQPLEQIAALSNSALGINTQSLPKSLKVKYENWLSEFLEFGWYGHSIGKKSFLESCLSIYPMHPSVLPVVVEFFHKFGQNERSLFSFLLSNEPFGIQDISANRDDSKVYGLHDLYDYIKVNFGHKLYTQSFRNNWHVIDSLVESFTGSDEIDLQVLKTIGVLNLLNNNKFIANEQSLSMSLETVDINKLDLNSSISNLINKRIIYNRGINGGYCLWAHTSVNLDLAYQNAQKEIGDKVNVIEYIKENNQPRPIVARRHYIKTGNLRAFSCNFFLPEEIEKITKLTSSELEGHIIIPLCETQKDYDKVIAFMSKSSLKKQQNILWAIPQPLQYLEKLIKDLKCWEYVERNTLELNSDFYAYEEVSRQIHDAKERLEIRLRSFIDLKNFTDKDKIKWFYCGKEQKLKTGRALLSFLSDCFDSIYYDAPIIKNELVNRRNLSSAAAAARMRLIPLILTNGNEIDLGLEEGKTPPEKAIYLSIIQNAGFHSNKKLKDGITQPAKKNDVCNFRHAMNCIHELLTKKLDSKIAVDSIYNELMAPPYGVREGIIPILLAVYVAINETDLAIYEDGTFLRQIREQEFLRLTKAPQKFEFQYCSIGGVRKDLFPQMIEMLNVPTAKDEPHLLDVVKPLCVFVVELPDYVQKTKRIADTTVKVRNVIKNAQSPLDLIFTDLPKACGFSPLTEKTAKETIEEFISVLRISISELQMCYNNLKERIKDLIAQEFNESNQFTVMRRNIAQRAEGLLVTVTEPNLKAFVFRVFDDGLAEAQWIESMGSFITSKTPDRWLDNDEDKFTAELPLIVSRFKNAESINYSKNKNSNDKIGYRVALTKATGDEKQEVLFYSKDEASEIENLQKKIAKVIQENERLGVVAASQEIWNFLTNGEKH